MLTSEQRREFERTGIVTIPDAIMRTDALAMRDQVWALLEQNRGVKREDPRTWKEVERINGSHVLGKTQRFEQVASLQVSEALDDLLGSCNWQDPDRWGYLLFSFPRKGVWDVPHTAWHLDFPAPSGIRGVFAVRVFTCLERLEARGGGTLFVAGSHKLADKLIDRDGITLRSADVRKLLIRYYPWMRSLCTRDKRGETVNRTSRFMSSDTTVDGAELRVVEMTGEPGDVMLTHPLLLHAGAQNCAALPRIVLSTTIFRSDVNLGALYESQPGGIDAGERENFSG